jgi:S-adenosylmethionine:tRNA ribosyltransferase-isomerase
MNPRELRISDYTYELPAHRVAQRPVFPRDSSKLLVFKNERITEAKFYELTDFIEKDSLLVVNTTRVIHARLIFKNEFGGIVEIFCLEPVSVSLNEIFLQNEKGIWECLIGKPEKWREDYLVKNIIINNHHIELKAKKLKKREEIFEIEFSWQTPELSFAEIIEAAGEIPLPPYLKRKPEKTDEENYQTIYANEAGSVAAPTAGLHFSSKVFQKLKEKNIETLSLTLHVGAGTFKPVKAEKMNDHLMHSERFFISKNALTTLYNFLLNKKIIVATGTTTLRTLESLYRIGIKPEKYFFQNRFRFSQWEAYEQEEKKLAALDSIERLIEFCEKNNLETVDGETSLLIAPGFQFQIVNALITNFHQPNSTLLLLVAAFAGNEWRKIYDFALENDFRFLSYGDSSILFRQ